MKNTIRFSTPATFGLATVLADINALACAIDNASQVIWTDDVAGFASAFDAGGIDPEEYTVTAGSKADYNKLAKALAEAAEMAAAAEAKETEESSE